jgi:hypothetical protein
MSFERVQYGQLYISFYYCLLCLDVNKVKLMVWIISLVLNSSIPHQSA